MNPIDRSHTASQHCGRKRAHPEEDQQSDFGLRGRLVSHRQQPNDGLVKFSSEIWECFFSFLDHAEQARSSLVSRQFRQQVDNSRFYEEILEHCGDTIVPYITYGGAVRAAIDARDSLCLLNTAASIFRVKLLGPCRERTITLLHASIPNQNDPEFGSAMLSAHCLLLDAHQAGQSPLIKAATDLWRWGIEVLATPYLSPDFATHFRISLCAQAVLGFFNVINPDVVRQTSLQMATALSENQSLTADERALGILFRELLTFFFPPDENPPSPERAWQVCRARLCSKPGLYVLKTMKWASQKRLSKIAWHVMDQQLTTRSGLDVLKDRRLASFVELLDIQRTFRSPPLDPCENCYLNSRLVYMIDDLSNRYTGALAQLTYSSQYFLTTTRSDLDESHLNALQELAENNYLRSNIRRTAEAALLYFQVVGRIPRQSIEHDDFMLGLMALKILHLPDDREHGNYFLPRQFAGDVALRLKFENRAHVISYEEAFVRALAQLQYESPISASATQFYIYVKCYCRLMRVGMANHPLLPNFTEHDAVLSLAQLLNIVDDQKMLLDIKLLILKAYAASQIPPALPFSFAPDVYAEELLDHSTPGSSIYNQTTITLLNIYAQRLESQQNLPENWISVIPVLRDILNSPQVDISDLQIARLNLAKIFVLTNTPLISRHEAIAAARAVCEDPFALMSQKDACGALLVRILQNNG